MMKLPLVIPVKRIQGKGRGKKLGIPTLNFEIPQHLKLPHGIYAGLLISGNKKYKAAIHFGPRPQFNEPDPSLEAYLLDGSTEHFSNNIQLELVKYIRPIQSFVSVEKMLKRIDVDIKEIAEILKSLRFTDNI